MPSGLDHSFFIAVIFLLAGIVKGVAGLGLPTVAIGLLSLVMPPSHAAALVVVPSMITNLAQLRAGPPLRPLLRRLWPFLAAICVATAVPFLFSRSGWLVGAGSGATAALGAALITYAAFGLSPIRPPVISSRSERWLAPISGFLTGLVAAATGVFVIPAVPYLGALGLARDELIQALGLAFTISTLALAASLGAAQSSIPGPITLVATLIPALLGMAIGTTLRRRISPTLFRKCFFAALLALGLNLAFN